MSSPVVTSVGNSVLASRIGYAAPRKKSVTQTHSLKSPRFRCSMQYPRTWLCLSQSGWRQVSWSWPCSSACALSTAFSRPARITWVMEMMATASVTPMAKGCQKSTPAVICVWIAFIPGTQCGMKP